MMCIKTQDVTQMFGSAAEEMSSELSQRVARSIAAWKQLKQAMAGSSRSFFLGLQEKIFTRP